MNKWMVIWGLCLSFFAHGDGGQVAIITGASRGVGLSTAQLLADKGYTVYATTRTPSKVEHLERENLRFIHMDLMDKESIQSCVKEIAEKEAHIDVLINNAGFALIGPVEELAQRQIQEQLEVNFLAPIRCIQAILPYMRQNKSGHIINISSVNAVSTPTYGSMYASSKAALEALSESLYAEVKPFNI